MPHHQFMAGSEGPAMNDRRARTQRRGVHRGCPLRRSGWLVESHRIPLRGADPGAHAARTQRSRAAARCVSFAQPKMASTTGPRRSTPELAPTSPSRSRSPSSRPATRPVASHPWWRPGTGAGWRPTPGSGPPSLLARRDRDLAHGQGSSPSMSSWFGVAVWSSQSRRSSTGTAVPRHC